MVFAVLVASFATQIATAQQVRKVPAMSLKVHRLVMKAQSAMDGGDLQSAQGFLREVLDRKKTNEYEHAVVWQLRAMIAFKQNNTPATIDAYEMILTYRNSIPVALEHQIIYGLSQLYFSAKNYTKAQTYAETRQGAVDPSLIGAPNYKYLADIAYLTGDYDRTIQQAELAFEQVEKTKPSSLVFGLHQLVASANWEKKSYAASLSSVRQLLTMELSTRGCELSAALFEALGADKESAIAQARAEAPRCADAEFRMNLADAFGTVEAGNGLVKDTVTETQRAKDTLPIVRVVPRYPRKAQEEGVEGTVIISLTILPDGSVDRNSIKIVEASPPGYFEETVIKAASLFKYKPKIVAGIAQRVEGVRYSFSFNLAN